MLPVATFSALLSTFVVFPTFVVVSTFVLESSKVDDDAKDDVSNKLSHNKYEKTQKTFVGFFVDVDFVSFLVVVGVFVDVFVVVVFVVDVVGVVADIFIVFVVDPPVDLFRSFPLATVQKIISFS